MGKISAGILLASAAYRKPDEFRKLTGINQAQLLTDPVSDTTVLSISGPHRINNHLSFHAGFSAACRDDHTSCGLQCYVGYTEGSAYIIFRGASALAPHTNPLQCFQSCSLFSIGVLLSRMKQGRCLQMLRYGHPCCRAGTYSVHTALVDIQVSTAAWLLHCRPTISSALTRPSLCVVLFQARGHPRTCLPGHSGAHRCSQPLRKHP